MKTNIRILTCLAGLLLAAPSWATEYRLERTRDFQPEYPRSAIRQDLEGWVDLAVTVTPSGKVSQLEIIDAEPRRVFERAALRAANRWEFAPPAESGVNEPQRAVYRVRFQLN